jgi:hypothetical protein
MAVKRNRAGSGLTLIELMITLVAGLIVILGVSALLFHGHLGYQRLFRRVNSDVVRNAYEARILFDLIVRKSSVRRCDLSIPRNNGFDQCYVYYYSNAQDMTIIDPDRYARFYLNGDNLLVERGDVQLGTFEDAVPGRTEDPTTPSPLLLARNVVTDDSAPGIFSLQANAVRMVLTLDNETTAAAGVNKIETLKMTSTTTAIRHNN